MKNQWFKILAAICIVVITGSVIYYLFFFLPEERDYNRAEAKRYECKQEVQARYNEYNATANSVEQTDENKQLLFSLALNLGIIDQSGKPFENKTLVDKCLNGEL